MKYLFVGFLSIFFLIRISGQPLPAKNHLKIIIDTDCGIDDIRAISMMLARPEIKIKGIITSDGSIPPSEGALKVNSLLYEFNRNEIPVASGISIKGVNPPWRQFNRDIKWGNQTNIQAANIKVEELLMTAIKSSDDKIIIVCLGPLTNVAAALKKHPEIETGIEKILWYNESIKPISGFNYACDPGSADGIINSRIRIDIISNLSAENSIFDKKLYESCELSDTKLAKVLVNVFSQDQARQRLNQGHYKLDDDLVAVYITNPELFGMNITPDRLNVRYNTEYDVAGVREVIKDMISGSYSGEKNIVFSRFPADRSMFNYDIRPIIDTAIALYGYDEWKANVMTDEFHGHLGVFSIVGAKMGIKAREIFGVGPDQLVVTSYAGTRPPYSCLNDGIQVSTGATLGMGTIHLANDTIYRPSAIFKYKDRSVTITLKKEYLDMVDSDINEGIIKYGLMDDGYWKLIRRNAIKYWLEWDRDKIFDIAEIN